MQIISPPSGIKSVQRGTAYLNSVSSLNVTIASVNMSKSEVKLSTRVYSSGSDLSVLMCSVKLATPTQLTFDRAASSGQCFAEWEIVEYA